MRRIVTTAGFTAALLAASSWVGTTAANASTAGTSRDVSDHISITVRTDASGRDHVTGGLRHHAGHYVIRYVNANRHGSDVVLVQLRGNATLAELVQKIQQQNAGGPQGPTPAQLRAAAASTRWLNLHVRAYGGAGFEQPGQAWNTETLPAGRYLFLDVNKIFAHQTGYLVGVLDVHGRLDADDTTLPRSSGSVTMVKGDRFRVSGALDADGNILIRNRSDSIHMVEFTPVRPGTTDAQMTALFAAEASGKPPAADPTDHSRPGVLEDVLTPGRSVVFHTNALKPGLYDLECFVADDMTGMPHAFMGMHKVVVLH